MELGGSKLYCSINFNKMLVSDFSSWQKGVEKQSVEIVKFTFIAF